MADTEKMFGTGDKRPEPEKKVELVWVEFTKNYETTKYKFFKGDRRRCPSDEANSYIKADAAKKSSAPKSADK